MYTIKMLNLLSSVPCRYPEPDIFADGKTTAHQLLNESEKHTKKHYFKHRIAMVISVCLGFFFFFVFSESSKWRHSCFFFLFFGESLENLPTFHDPYCNIYYHHLGMVEKLYSNQNWSTSHFRSIADWSGQLIAIQLQCYRCNVVYITSYVAICNMPFTDIYE